MSEKKTITIRLSGDRASGKTTLAVAIFNYLSGAGIAAKIARSVGSGAMPKIITALEYEDVRRVIEGTQVVIEEGNEAERYREALEQIKALKDGYQGGHPEEYAEGRKAGYRVAGEIAERALGGKP